MSFCTQCGTQLAEDAAFCSSCGTSTAMPVAHQYERIHASAPDVARQDAMSSQDNADDIRIFLGKNEDYFLSRWAQFEQTGKNLSFNVVAFVIGVGWLAYRKMYVPALCLGGVLFMITINEVVFDLNEWLAVGLDFIAYLFCGLLGNFWYKRHVEKKVGEIMKTITPDQVNLELARQGGVNLSAGIGFAAAYLIGIALIYGMGGGMD